MKRLDIGVQLVPREPQFFGHFDPFVFRATRSAVPTAPELFENPLAVRLVRMKLEYRVVKPRCHEPAVHDIERRRLLGNEEHSLSSAEALSDHVCDALALAGARRSDKNEITAFRSSDDGSELRAVRG